MCIAYSQPKGAEVWAALRKGFDAPEADPSWTPGRQRPLYRNGTAILGGLDFDQPALLREARQVGHPYLFVDAGYLAPNINGRRARYRVVPDAYNHFWMPPPGFGAHLTVGRLRFNTLGLKIEPWRTTGRNILVCTSSRAHAEFFGLQNWVADTVATLKRYTDRPIIVRDKAQAKHSQPFAEALKDAYAVVAWSSAVCVEAALAGVPVFTGPESAALPVSAGMLCDIERPAYHDREPWAWHLACGQFTVDELAGDTGSVFVGWAEGARKTLKAA